MKRTSSRHEAQGLTHAEAAAHLHAEGANELPRQGRRNLLRILAEVLREPMLALLVAGGVIYLLFGDLGEALILLVFATFSVAVTVVQETRTERLLERLRDLTSPRALVIRGGQRLRIPGREVVRGDLIVLAEGDRVAADARLITADELEVDESLLTGESLPVRKQAAAPVEDRRPGGDDLPLVFGGTLITRGSGLAEVIATGPRSEIGRIGLSLATLETEPPRLRQQTMRLVRIFGILGGVAAGTAILLYGLLRGDWLEAALAGIALGMAMLPEEFPVVLTVFMAMGAWRISQARVLTRRAASIESLGAATVLCTDKTGTLTQNRMRVQDARTLARELDLKAKGDAAVERIALAGLLASAPHPTDPMDDAFHDLARRAGIPSKGKNRRWTRLLKAFGLQPDLMAVTQLWEDAGGARLAAAKGAPEAIARLCHVPPTEMTALQGAVNAMAGRGMRVLAVASAPVASPDLPDSPLKIRFRLEGIVGLADPLRPQVADAVKDCRTAGIRVVMITGDYPVTARAIATAAGIDGGREVSGTELAGMDEAALRAAVRETAVFSRVLPEQKLRIVEALKAQGEIVAMTGDGVNDAPSLKAAHIGVAMGGRGTDVAREAAGIVLLDDDFGSIVKAVRLGRRIYDNLRKAMEFILAVHVPIAGMALMPLALGLPIIFGPIHIAFLEMIIDPVCSLVFEAEPEEEDIMNRPPRHPEAPLFSPGLILWSVLQGLMAFGLVCSFYFWGVHQALPEAELRALTFFALVTAIVALIYANRSFSASPLKALTGGNRLLVLVPAAVGLSLALILNLPWTAALFSFGPLHGHDVLAGLLGAVALFLLLEILKLPVRRALRR